MSGPFKMKGHSLPGPNQASPAKQTTRKMQTDAKKNKLEYGTYGMPGLRGTTKGPSTEKPTPTPEMTPERIAWESGKSYGLMRTYKKLKPKKKNIVKSFVDFAKSKKK